MKRKTEYVLAALLCIFFGFVLPGGALLWIVALVFIYRALDSEKKQS
jgi:hypothetical protein